MRSFDEEAHGLSEPRVALCFFIIRGARTSFGPERPPGPSMNEEARGSSCTEHTPAPSVVGLDTTSGANFVGHISRHEEHERDISEREAMQVLGGE